MSMEEVVIGLISLLIGWLFKLISDNRTTVKEIENKLENNCRFVGSRIDEMNDRLEEHKLYVANNYVRDSKIETMIKHYTQPIHDQLGMLQTTLNTLLVQMKARDMGRRYEDE